MTNSAGSILSRNATLTVDGRPFITAQPVAQSVPTGSGATFSVVAGSPSPLSYQWRKDGVNLAGATASILTLDRTSPTSAGVYSVVVTNAAGSIASSNAPLTIGQGLLITAPPAAQTVPVGGTVTFSVEAGGAPAPAYQWIKDGAPLAGATQATLTLARITFVTAGSYAVRVSDSAGTVTSAAAELTVNGLDVVRTYFGPAPGGGTWALGVRPDNTATFLAFLPDLTAAIRAEVSISADGSFSVTGNTLDAEGTALPAARSFTLTGRITNGQVTGQVLGKTLTGAIDLGSAAGTGVYRASALLAAKGTTHAMVGPSGKILVMVATPAGIDGLVGELGSGNILNAVSANRAQVTLSVNATARWISVSYLPAGTTNPITFYGVPDSVRATAALGNLSIRTAAGTAEQTLIVGFALSGGSKTVLVRGIGPTLADFGVQGSLPDPKLDLLRQGSSSALATNDNWSADTGDVFARVGAFALPNGSRDAALVTTLDAGTYTAQLADAGGASGTALLELYDTGPSGSARLVNVSARSQVGTGGAVLIAGFNVTGTGPRRLLIRAIGPTLTAFGVSGALADPRLDLFTSGGAAIASNNDWDPAVAATSAAVGAFALPPGSWDSVLLVTLTPGSYTAQVSGVGDTAGLALVEIYEVP